MNKHVKLAVVLTTLCMSALTVQAQKDFKYPFQNPKLDSEKRITNLISLMTLDEKILMFGGEGVPRLGVRSAGGTEAIHGIVQGGVAWKQQRKEPEIPTTSFPQGYGLGETWDTEILQKVGETMSTESRYIFQNPNYRRGALILWAPNADLGRDPRWGRTEECFGEDAYLTGQLTQAMVRGIQGDNPKYWRGASLMKHFLANSNECSRYSTSSNFSDTLFREYYSWPFWKGVQSGSNALMAAYNAYNGIACTLHPMLKDILMNEWGFNGHITTDGNAFKLLWIGHRQYVDDHAMAAAACIKAGISRYLDTYKDELRGALQKGYVTEAELDENLRGTLRVMLKLGLMDDSDENPYKNIGVTDTTAPWEKKEAKDLARLAADKAVVLLKNEKNTLPLQLDKIKTIAVVGNRADSIFCDWYGGAMPYRVTPLDAIKEMAKPYGIEVLYAKNDNVGAAQDLAKKADVVIVCVGNDPTGGTGWSIAPWGQIANAAEGREDMDRSSLQLEQEDLVKLVHKVNPNTILALISSFPYTINWSNENLPAIVHLTQSHQELGHALSDVLSGKYNPAGRLTQTWPTDITDLPEMLDYDLTHGRTYMFAKKKPLYPFGYGLSYSTFEYTNLNVVKEKKTVKVSFSLTNTSAVDGEEVAQVYVRYQNDNADKRLKGFRRIGVAKGEKKEIVIEIPAEDLFRWNEAEHAFKAPEGTMTVMVGSSSADIKLKKDL